MTDVKLSDAVTPSRFTRLHRVPGLLLLGLATYFAWQSLALGLGEATQIGPGMWPLMICVFTGSAAAVLVFIDRPLDYEVWTRRSLRIVVGLVALGLFITAFGQIGFILPAAALMLFWLRAFAAEPWRLAIPVAVGTAVCLYLIFVVALGVPFPAEPFGRSL
jgi:putative tricarboxylic transport membrane protein